jgi:hypothetical protein
MRQGIMIVGVLLLCHGSAQAESHGRRGRSHTSRQPQQPPDKPNEDDAYIHQEYGKHIGPNTKVPPTPSDTKTGKVLRTGQ